MRRNTQTRLQKLALAKIQENPDLSFNAAYEEVKESHMITDETQNAGEYLEVESRHNIILRIYPHFRVVNAITDAASVCGVHTLSPNASCMVALGIAMEASKWYAFHCDTQEARQVKEGVEKAIACLPLWDEQVPLRVLLETLLLLPIDPGGKREIQGYITKIKEGRWE